MFADIRPVFFASKIPEFRSDTLGYFGINLSLCFSCDIRESRVLFVLVVDAHDVAYNFVFS